MVRQTSIETFKQIKESGLLSLRRFQVYEILFKHGPLTQRELAEKIGDIENSLRPRFAELERSGVIAITQKRTCSISGRTVLEWDVTDRLPIKLDKPKRIKCPHCKGKGHLVHQQASFL